MFVICNNDCFTVFFDEHGCTAWRGIEFLSSQRGFANGKTWQEAISRLITKLKLD